MRTRTERSKPPGRIESADALGGGEGEGNAGRTPVGTGQQHAVARVADVVQDRIDAARRSRRRDDVRRLDGDPRREVRIEHVGQRLQEFRRAGEPLGVGQVLCKSSVSRESREERALEW